MQAPRSVARLGFVFTGGWWLAVVSISLMAGLEVAVAAPWYHAGVAVRDITPEVPIRLAGYAGRKRPADRVDHPLLVQALALRSTPGDRLVLVALDNCEVSRSFMEPVEREWETRFSLKRGAVVVVPSHTHSAPVLSDTLTNMGQLTPDEWARIDRYSRDLRARLVEVVGGALADQQPASLEVGLGRCSFAMNRRVYQGDKVVFGDNPDGPVDLDVPVLRVRTTNGMVRAIVFGYACHGTSVRSGDDWYVVSGEYMAYARHHLEAHEPGAAAIFLTGFGADADPAPRGRLLDARRHGLELAGAVMGVLNRPMKSVRGPLQSAFAEVSLPLVDPPGRAQLLADAGSADPHIKHRAETYLKRMDNGAAVPKTVPLPVAVARFGNDMTLVLVGGEVVVDYSRRLKRLLLPDWVWTVGYAFETPCYIPSARLLKEGGYETESSMIYYGLYGPFRGSIEERLVGQIASMVEDLRQRP